MGTKERREREKTEIRDKILDAARELFASEGYEGVSMRRIAEMIEYSPTAIYLHFADKEQLFRELCHADFGSLRVAFADAAQERDPVQRIRAIGHSYVQFGLTHPNQYKLMFMTAHPVTELDDRDCAVKGNPELDAYAFLKLAVEQAISDGLLRPELTDAELVSQTLWAAVHGVISLQIAKQDEPWVEWRPMEARSGLMLDAILRGMSREGK